MKNMILTVMMLVLAIVFTGCDKASAQNAKKDQPTAAKTAEPKPHAVLIIDEVAYIDGCNGCECVEEGVCVCEPKADCSCCRKNLKKAPADMQNKCKEMKKAHAKKVASCDDCKKNTGDTACNGSKEGDSAKKGK